MIGSPSRSPRVNGKGAMASPSLRSAELSTLADSGNTSPPPLSRDSLGGSDINGAEAVEQDLNELLSSMEASYKTFSESVFKKMDEMRDKISVLDDTTADLISGLDEIADSSVGDSARPGRVRKRRS